MDDITQSSQPYNPVFIVISTQALMGSVWWLNTHLCGVYKNHLPTSVTLCSISQTGWTVSPLWVCANWSFTSVYVARVNNLIFQFSLWYKRYDKADIRTGVLRVCWQKRLQFGFFSQLGGLQFWGLPTRVLGDSRHHASDLCHAWSYVYSTLVGIWNPYVREGS